MDLFIIPVFYDIFSKRNNFLKMGYKINWRLNLIIMLLVFAFVYNVMIDNNAFSIIDLIVIVNSVPVVSFLIVKLLNASLNKLLLNHTLEHLKGNKLEILEKTLKEQSKYADNICIETINDIDFVKNQLEELKNYTPETFATVFNTTSIGNLAFIALNTPEEYANKAKQFLEDFKKYMQEN